MHEHRSIRGLRMPKKSLRRQLLLNVSNSLKHCGHLSAVYSISYRLLDPTERFTIFLNRAKAGADEKVRQRACACLAAYAPELWTAYPGDGRLLVVPLISSASCTAGPGEFPYQLAKAVVDAMNLLHNDSAEFCPDLLGKRPHRSIHTITEGPDARHAEVIDAYHTLREVPKTCRILLVDDFVTLGSTLSGAAKALVGSYTGSDVRIAGLTLALCCRPQHGTAISNAHLQPSIWQLAGLRCGSKVKAAAAARTRMLLAAAKVVDENIDISNGSCGGTASDSGCAPLEQSAVPEVRPIA